MRKVILLLLTVALLLAPNCLSAPGQAQVATTSTPPTADAELAAKLAKVQRIYIESFGDDPASKQMQALLIDSLTQSKRFIITENKDHADAVIKGVGTERTSQEFHSTREGTAVATGRTGAGISDSSASTETITTAHLTVRMVSTDGDVIWSTEKESTGGKYKGASADVADEVVKQLLHDLD
jgi:ABC-type amino acid transport substrate-binding protein